MDSRENIGAPQWCPACGGNVVITHASTGPLRSSGAVMVYAEWKCEKCGKEGKKKV